MTIRIIRSIIKPLGGNVMTFRELEKLLISNGWYHHHTNGSHYIYKHNETKRKLTGTPNHIGDIPKGTLNNILKQAGLK